MKKYKVILTVIRKSGRVSTYAGTVKAESETALQDKLVKFCNARWPNETCTVLINPNWISLKKVLDSEGTL